MSSSHLAHRRTMADRVQAARRPTGGTSRHPGGLSRPVRWARRPHDPGDRDGTPCSWRGCPCHELPWMYLAMAAAGRPRHADEGRQLVARSSAAGAPGRLRRRNAPLLGGGVQRAVGAARALRLDGARRRRSCPWRSGCCSARSTPSRRRVGCTARSGSGASSARWRARRSPAGWRAGSTRATCWPRRPPSSSLTALGPARIVTAGRSDAPPGRAVGAAPAPLGGSGRRAATRTWLAVAGLVLLSTIAFTLGDYVFKSAVARGRGAGPARELLRVLLPGARTRSPSSRSSSSPAG